MDPPLPGGAAAPPAYADMHAALAHAVRTRHDEKYKRCFQKSLAHVRLVLRETLNPCAFKGAVCNCAGRAHGIRASTRCHPRTLQFVKTSNSFSPPTLTRTHALHYSRPEPAMTQTAFLPGARQLFV